MSPPSSSTENGGFKFVKYFNLRLAYSCSIIALSQINFGLEQGVFTNTQAMDAFVRKFGVYNAQTKKYALQSCYLSLLNSLTYIGFSFGLVLGNTLSGKFGRRKCFVVMSGWALIGAVILVTAKNRWQMVAGRIIAYVYIGMELALVPVLQSEIVPAKVRGLVVGTYQSSLIFGQLIGALVCYGTKSFQDDKSFRIPIGLLFVIPTLLLCGIWYVPESPRWLLSKGRDEEAMRSLTLLRQGRYTEEDIESEFREFKTTLNATVEKGRMMELFQGTNLKRTLIVIGVNVFLQITGQNFISVYGTIFIKSIGVIDAFSMSCINTTVQIVSVLITQSMTDFTGRVPLMFTGAIIQTGALFVMGALGTPSAPSFSMRQGIVAMTTIFGFGFGLGWAPLSHVVAAEIPTQRLRDKTYALGACFNIVIQFAISFSIPYLINADYAGLGSKVGFIFGATALGAVVFTWFCIPECSGKSLEEIDELFLEGTPIRKFKKASGLAGLHALEQLQEEGKGSVARVERVDV